MDKVRKCIAVAAVIFGFGACFASAQTTVAGSVYGAFRSSTSGPGTPISAQYSSMTSQSPSNAAGVLLEVRHIWNPLIGVEVTYSYNRANESYADTQTLLCSGAPCPYTRTTASIPANAHEVTADWVGSFRLGDLRPFVLAGYGFLLHVPTAGSVTATATFSDPLTNMVSRSTSSIPTRTQTKGVFVYGAGVDWTVLPHIGLRFQYRGNVYKTASLARAFTSTDKFTQDAEPMVGVFIRF